MSDADAFEIAHPLPGGEMNFTSAMRSPSSFTDSLTSSPHSGLRPSTTRSAPSISPKFRGLRLCSRMSSWYSASVDMGLEQQILRFAQNDTGTADPSLRSG